MTRHEVVNEILEYLDIRKRELEEDMQHSEGSDLEYYEGSYETYDHLIAKLEDDYR